MVIFVKTKSGNFVEHAGVFFESSGLFCVCVCVCVCASLG